jgi:hypothetical protein
VILSVANRFRTKGIQEEAMRQCEQLAVRKGWTLDQLADRTIPTCGLDDSGTLELDYGSRTFTVSLSEDMAVVVVNQNGKSVASLPDANQSDDAEKVRQAKSALSTARKELKSRFDHAEGSAVRSVVHAARMEFRGLGRLSPQTSDRGTLLPTTCLGSL